MTGTAVSISINRFPWKSLPLDGISARHLGMTHGAGAKLALFNSFSLSRHPEKPGAYPRRELRLTDDRIDRRANGETRFYLLQVSMRKGRCRELEWHTDPLVPRSNSATTAASGQEKKQFCTTTRNRADRSSNAPS